jgi:AAA15 family ATPase/GTPase
MYSSLHIKNFRNLRDLEINALGRVNLISGKNNVGKTALLEAIFLLNGPVQPELRTTIAAARGMEVVVGKSAASIWEAIFNEFDTDETIEISSNSTQGNSHLEIYAIDTSKRENVSLTTPDSSSSPSSATTDLSDDDIEYRYTHGDSDKVYRSQVRLIGNEIHYRADKIDLPIAVFMFARLKANPENDADRFSQAIKLRLKNDIVEALKIIEPALTDIELVYEAKRAVLYGEVGPNNKIRPLPLMGDGMGRLLSILVNMAYAAPDGIILIDEIENGFHFSILPQVWHVIDEFSRKHNIQVFATTHSDECIEAAKGYFEESDPTTFRYHRLDRLEDGRIEAVTYDKETFESAIEFDIEVR